MWTVISTRAQYDLFCIVMRATNFEETMSRVRLTGNVQFEFEYFREIEALSEPVIQGTS